MFQKSFGFTLIEMMVTVAIAAILLAVAIPSFTQMMDKKRLEGAAESLYADLQLAQSEAIKANKTIKISFYTNSTVWCYGLTDNTAGCNCQALNSCMIGGIQRTVSSDEFQNITISSSLPTFSFSPPRGTANTSKIEFQSASNQTLQVKVSGFGRVKLCSPAGAGNLGGYPVC
ncbi:fimbrial protein pilin [Candidatus Nitrosoglobus terrae]|uniref:Type II secretion system protein H n=1 Tax=Candidatus Nitrosoglobus terrae TaxID=1630141 RepID=A0A1Q2SM38_9GAMM|nr:GspH/FimT family pseudopilin [Candidatus Nitrosoglobus terrae]BAW80191.1 fimbrial protein pilin [Candidatus Nitrosoglobus terrae]